MIKNKHFTLLFHKNTCALPITVTVGTYREVWVDVLFWGFGWVIQSEFDRIVTNRLYSCDICSFTATSPRGLSNHRADHHGGPRS
jgi:hypothetical protein